MKRSFFFRISALLGLIGGMNSMAATREWTVIVYAAADEGFNERKSAFTQASLSVNKDLERLSALRHEEVVVVSGYDASGDDADGTMNNREWRRRIQYLPDSPPDRLASPPISEQQIQKIDPGFRYTEPNSASPTELKRFLKWAIAAYPAKHYLLILQGHGSGKNGLLTDFNVNGKDVSGDIMKTYELRRVMEELYREDAKSGRPHIPQGKFDALLVDACGSGELESSFEWKELFTYFIGTSLDVPYYSLPYTDILDPFLTEVVTRARQGQSTGDSAFIETRLLSPIVHQGVVSHSPGGKLVSAEKHVDVVQMFAIRLKQLEPVVAALKRLITDMPQVTKSVIKDMLPKEAWALRDVDENADLRSLARAFRTYYSERLQSGGGIEWQTALDSAIALEASLGYQAPNPSLATTPISHASADGAWIHYDIDTTALNGELASCFLIRTLAVHNWRHANVVPRSIRLGTKNKNWSEVSCHHEFSEAGPDATKPKPLVSGRPFRLDRIFGGTVDWPAGVSAFLTEYREQDTLKRRTFSLYLPKQVERLSYALALRMPGTSGFVVEYISGNANDYLMKKPGYAAQMLGREQDSYSPWVLTDPRYFVPAPGQSQPLYVAEAHSHGAQFKEGFGLYFGTYFNEAGEWHQNGVMPLDLIEKALGLEPFSLTLEQFEAERAEIEKRVKKAGCVFMRTGGAFYQMNRLARSTGWADLLGAKNDGCTRRN